MFYSKRNLVRVSAEWTLGKPRWGGFLFVEKRKERASVESGQESADSTSESSDADEKVSKKKAKKEKKHKKKKKHKKEKSKLVCFYVC